MSEQPGAPPPGNEESSRARGLRARIGELKPDEFLLLDELTDQLDRTRRLLRGDSEQAAEAALAQFSGQAEVEARIVAELAVKEPIAQPARFGEAHRLVMRAIEVLDREGYRSPEVRGVGPLKPVMEAGAEFIAAYIVKSYTQSIIGSLKNLYARRETQSPPDSPERRALARARVEMERVAPSFSGGGIGAPLVVVGGVVVPLFASVTQYFGAIDFANRFVLFGGLAVLFVLFFLLSGMMLGGASVARRRSRLIMQQPLAALWETVGNAGSPPEDDSTLFALLAIILTAALWFVLPAVGAAVYFLF